MGRDEVIRPIDVFDVCHRPLGFVAFYLANCCPFFVSHQYESSFEYAEEMERKLLVSKQM